MSKFTFICEEDQIPFLDSVSSKKTVEFSADSLSQILEQFEMFLRGCGFHFNGCIDMVEEESYEEYQEDSQFDFSEIPQNNWPFGDTKPENTISER